MWGGKAIGGKINERSFTIEVKGGSNWEKKRAFEAHKDKRARRHSENQKRTDEAGA